MKKLAWSALVLAAACSSGGGNATRPATTPADSQQLAELRTSMTEMLERLDVLNDRITRMEQAQAELQSMERRPQPAAAATPAPPSAAVVGAQMATAYREAIVLYGRNRMSEARAAFQKVFDADPHSELADNALFWIGETYFNAAQYGDAMRYYSRVARDYGDQNKAPDALFKLALAYEKTSDLALAKKTLEEVISRYPYSSPASTARAELKRISY